MKRSLIVCIIVLVALVGFGMVANEAAAKDLTVTLAPGDTARIPIKFWCLDFGKPFPTAITVPITSPPDAALLVLQAALARGTTESDPYQTQLAIWRAADGTFHDTGGTGHVLAEQIYSDSLKLQVPPVPTNSLAAAVTQGSVQVTFENFTPISDTTHSNLPPYSGTADLVVKNTSSQSVTFVALDGAVYKPASGTNEQTLISHQDSTKQAVLPTPAPTTAPTSTPAAGPSTAPTTGGNGLQDLPVQPLLLLELGGLLIILGIAIAGPMSEQMRARSTKK